MKEHPILFKGAMVRAILEGRKTVTRRLVTNVPPLGTNSRPVPYLNRAGRQVWGAKAGPVLEMANASCPFGQPGDRLWVRESFADLRGTGIEHRPDPAGPLSRYAYAADSPPGSHSDEARKDYGIKWKSSIHMPRSASRILLEITDVRVERLQDITYEQAVAEGVYREMRVWTATDEGGVCHKYPVPAFRDLWNSTGGDWDANPWVWVIEFRRVTV